MRFVVLVLLLAAPVAASAAGRIKIAVTEIKSVQGVATGTATILSDIVVSEVAKAGYEVLSQSDIAAMIGFDKQKKMLGCEETGCLAEIGGALGVDYMLTGQVGQIGTRYRISLLVVDTKKARVVARAAQFCDQNEDALARVAEATVAQVLAPVRGSGELPPPVAAGPSRSKPDLGVAPPRGSTSAAPAPTITASQPSGARRMTTGAWIATGGGAALVVGGIVTGILAKQQYDDLQKQYDAVKSQYASLQGSPGALDAYNGYVSTYDSKKSSIKSKAMIANVLVGAGVVSGAVGGWLYWSSGRSAVSLAPAVGDQSIGLVASGRF